MCDFCRQLHTCSFNFSANDTTEDNRTAVDKVPIVESGELMHVYITINFEQLIKIFE